MPLMVSMPHDYPPGKVQRISADTCPRSAPAIPSQNANRLHDQPVVIHLRDVTRTASSDSLEYDHCHLCIHAQESHNHGHCQHLGVSAWAAAARLQMDFFAASVPMSRQLQHPQHQLPQTSEKASRETRTAGATRGNCWDIGTALP